MSATALDQRFDAQPDRWPSQQIVWTFLALHVLIWWLLPALLEHNLPLDVIEQLAWGHEWQIVYFKHPPLPAWTLESIADITGRWPPALYLAGSLASGLSLLAIWRLGCDMLGRQRALLAVLAQEGVLYFTIFTPEFNHNVVLLPLWAAIGLTGYRACFPAEGKPAMRHWCWFGAFAALGMLGKYTTALLLLPLLLFAMSHRRVRRMWLAPGPWLALAVGLLVMLPHLLGLWRIEFAPLRFPFERAPSATEWYDHIVDPLLFSVAQLGDIAPALLAVALLMWRRPDERQAIRQAAPLPADVRAFLWTLTWAPVGIAVAASLVLGLHLKDMWGYPMWCFIGLFLIAELGGPITTRGVQRFAVAWLVILVVVPVVFAVQQTVGGRLLHKPLRTVFPGPELARAVERQWHAVVGDMPLTIVTGDVWLAGNVAFYGTGRASAYIDADPIKSPWITPADLARHGAVLIWQEPNAPPAWLKQFPNAVSQPSIELSDVPSLGHPAVRFAWAVLRPTP